MYCEKFNLDVCFKSLRQQAELLLEKHKGVDITIKEHKKRRTLEQNAWLHLVYQHIVDFWNETGFMPDGLSEKLLFLNHDIVAEWFKCKYGVKTTTKLSTKEIGEYIEKIQRDMVEQTYGEYEAIYPSERDYFERTGLSDENG